MAVDVKVTGMESVEMLTDQAEKKITELRKVLNEINTAIRTIGLEINQPPDSSAAD